MNSTLFQISEKKFYNFTLTSYFFFILNNIISQVGYIQQHTPLNQTPSGEIAVPTCRE